MERELFSDVVQSKTTVDSGVETGNDSNDSHIAFDSQSRKRVRIPRFRFEGIFEVSLPHPSIKNPSMNISREQANGSVESKDCGNIEVIICEGVVLSILDYKRYTVFSNLLMLEFTVSPTSA
jgi:hypothetical protein